MILLYRTLGNCQCFISHKDSAVATEVSNTSDDAFVSADIFKGSDACENAEVVSPYVV